MDFPVVLNQMIAPAIVGLLSHGPPSDVPRLISSIIVDPINRVVLAWPWPDVLIKCFKVIAPFIADTYPSATVALVLFVIGIVTTLLHRVPRFILRRGVHVMGLPFGGDISMSAHPFIVHVTPLTSPVS
jgi:hypothetical protein